jgi:hypothetical protein
MDYIFIFIDALCFSVLYTLFSVLFNFVNDRSFSLKKSKKEFLEAFQIIFTAFILTDIFYDYTSLSSQILN